VLADDERLHAGDAVSGRSSGESEATDHRAIDHVVHLSKRRRRSLSLQDFEEVAVIRLRGARVAVLDGARDFLTYRALPRAVGSLPGEAVLLARSADDALRVLVHV